MAVVAVVEAFTTAANHSVFGLFVKLPCNFTPVELCLSATSFFRTDFFAIFADLLEILKLFFDLFSLKYLVVGGWGYL